MRTRMNQILAVTAFALLTSVTTLFAQSADKIDKTLDGWTLLGTRIVDYTLDRDVISIDATRNSFTSLKFIVKNGTLNMHKATVHYTNGDSHDIEFSEEISKYNDGRIIDLKGNSRSISKVTFWYDTKSMSDNKSVVELWGTSKVGL